MQTRRVRSGTTIRALFAAVATLTATSAPATYDANTQGRIVDVLTYDDGSFLLRLDPMPAGPCANYFIVTAQVPADGRQAMLSRALVAYSQGNVVNIGYDSKVCVNGWYRVHRVG